MRLIDLIQKRGKRMFCKRKGDEKKLDNFQKTKKNLKPFYLGQNFGRKRFFKI